MSITERKVVTINYTLKDDDGNVIDSAQDSSFAYLHGADNIIPGLEQALEGKKEGESLSVAIEPANGYGERNASLSQVVPKDMFEDDAEIIVGMQFHAESPDGQPVVVTVTHIDGNDVTVDGNHPLAGINLNFDVDIISIRDASDEEMEHGHVHGPDGHHHH
ncbi:MAG: peptidylprolyl isomerase [Gammaproteobacteria bacterium]|nr:peptidylprolyl isomerase [Gammaproteobacteria bacterium]